MLRVLSSNFWRHLLILINAAMQYADYPSGLFDDLGVISSEEEDELLLLNQSLHKIEYFFACRRIQVGGMFVK